MLISMLFVGNINDIKPPILSRCLAIPVTQYVCNESGISDKISCFIQNINSSVFLNENVF